MHTKGYLPLIPAALLLAVHSSQLHGAEPTSQQEVDDVITVVGTRTERALSDVAATITVKSAEDIERELARNISDLVRFEPGISVGGTGDRFGLGGFNIRGIDGNRVLTIVDGVRVSDEFSFGPFLSARRDFIDVDSIYQAEIARGPISSLYGSDALGGVVALRTKTAADYLAGNERYVSFKTGYTSADETLQTAATLAAGNETFAAMLNLSRRDGQEQETSGSLGGTGVTRQDADPQDITVDSAIAKFTYKPSDSHRFELGIDTYQNETDTRLLSDYGSLSRGILITSRDSEDEKERTRVSLSYTYDAEHLLLDKFELLAYTQDSETTQLTLEGRLPPGPTATAQLRTRDSIFEQEIDGVLLTAHKSFEAGDVVHRLVYGVDYYQTENKTLRNGGTVDAATGVNIPEFSPLPTRDFPLTEVDQLAFFIQNEIELLDGRLTVSPGIRYDDFEAEASADAIFLAGNPGAPAPEDFADSEVTAKIAAVYEISPTVSVYGNVSEGFRAPPYDDVNVGFTNFIGGYKTISNAGLKSETSVGIELGARFRGAWGNVNVAVFQNDYEDFIESLATAPEFSGTGGIDPSDGLLTFQSVNLNEVEIDGVEVSGELQLGHFNEALAGAAFKFAVAYADGEDTVANEPLDSIEPLSAVLGVSYNAPSGKWGGDVIWTLAQGKDQSDINSASGRAETDGYGTLDLLSYMQVTDSLRVNFGLFNVTDKEYVRWVDTAGVGVDAVERFSQPGINARIDLRLEI
ncbi:MAG: TonB-dependent hemoglobin/transferrin/lactoferrin family receptor [Pseudomonadales bacterium]